MIIVKVPSVFVVFLPGDESLNLASIRRLQFESNPPIAVVNFENGDQLTYRGDKAMALYEAWRECQHIDKSRKDLWRHSGN